MIPCRFCDLNGEGQIPATMLAPQDERLEVRGRVVHMWRWLPVCDRHFGGWYASFNDAPQSYKLADADRS